MKRFETTLVDYDRTCRYYDADINKQFPYYNRNSEILREVADFDDIYAAANHYVRLYPRNVYGMCIRQVDENGKGVVGGDFLVETEPVGFDAFSDERLGAMCAPYIKLKRV